MRDVSNLQRDDLCFSFQTGGFMGNPASGWRTRAGPGGYGLYLIQKSLVNPFRHDSAILIMKQPWSPGPVCAILPRPFAARKRLSHGYFPKMRINDHDSGIQEASQGVILFSLLLSPGIPTRRPCRFK